MQTIERKEKYIDWCSNQVNDDTAWTRFAFISSKFIEDDEVKETRTDERRTEIFSLKTPKQMREIILKTIDPHVCKLCGKKIVEHKLNDTTFISNIWDDGSVYHKAHHTCILAFCGILPAAGFWEYVKYLFLLLLIALPFTLFTLYKFYTGWVPGWFMYSHPYMPAVKTVGNVWGFPGFVLVEAGLLCWLIWKLFRYIDKKRTRKQHENPQGIAV